MFYFNSDVKGNPEDVVLAADNLVQFALSRFSDQGHWSVAELGLQEEHVSSLSLFLRQLQPMPDGAWRTPCTVAGLQCTKGQALTLLVIVAFAERWRREGEEGDVWSVFDGLLGPALISFLDEGGQNRMREYIRECFAVRGLGRMCNMRHAFDFPDHSQFYFHTIRLNGGICRDSIDNGYDSKLAGWLRRDNPSDHTEVLLGQSRGKDRARLQQSRSFARVWHTLQAVSRRRVKSEEAREELARCGWILPEDVEITVQAALSIPKSYWQEHPTRLVGEVALEKATWLDPADVDPVEAIGPSESNGEVTLEIAIRPEARCLHQLIGFRIHIADRTVTFTHQPDGRYRDFRRRETISIAMPEGPVHVRIQALSGEGSVVWEGDVEGEPFDEVAVWPLGQDELTRKRFRSAWRADISPDKTYMLFVDEGLVVEGPGFSLLTQGQKGRFYALRPGWHPDESRVVDEYGILVWRPGQVFDDEVVDESQLKIQQEGTLTKVGAEVQFCVSHPTTARIKHAQLAVYGTREPILLEISSPPRLFEDHVETIVTLRSAPWPGQGDVRFGFAVSGYGRPWRPSLRLKVLCARTTLDQGRAFADTDGLRVEVAPSTGTLEWREGRDADDRSVIRSVTLNEGFLLQGLLARGESLRVRRESLETAVCHSVCWRGNLRSVTVHGERVQLTLDQWEAPHAGFLVMLLTGGDAHPIVTLAGESLEGDEATRTWEFDYLGERPIWALGIIDQFAQPEGENLASSSPSCCGLWFCNDWVDRFEDWLPNVGEVYKSLGLLRLLRLPLLENDALLALRDQVPEWSSLEVLEATVALWEAGPFVFGDRSFGFEADGGMASTLAGVTEVRDQLTAIADAQRLHELQVPAVAGLRAEAILDSLATTCQSDHASAMTSSRYLRPVRALADAAPALAIRVCDASFKYWLETAGEETAVSKAEELARDLARDAGCDYDRLNQHWELHYRGNEKWLATCLGTGSVQAESLVDLGMSPEDGWISCAESLRRRLQVIADRMLALRMLEEERQEEERRQEERVQLLGQASRAVEQYLHPSRDVFRCKELVDRIGELSLPLGRTLDELAGLFARHEAITGDEKRLVEQIAEYAVGARDLPADSLYEEHSLPETGEDIVRLKHLVLNVLAGQLVRVANQ